MNPKSVIETVREQDFTTLKERTKTRLYQLSFKATNHDGVDVVQEDWDNLIVLDACRADVFQEVNWIDGRFQTRMSKGSHSIEFLTQNFPGYYDDIVYISANPHVSPHPTSRHARFDGDAAFHHVDHIYLQDAAQEYGVTRPEVVSSSAANSVQRFPEKRRIIHYMQPHTPFIGGEFEGETIEELRDRPEELRQAYQANIRRALRSVDRLLDELPGTTVITADHGELFGEHGLWGHLYGVHFKELVEVPWLIVEPEGS